MNAAELQRENERLKRQLQEADARMKEAAAHRAALEEPFVRTMAEKDSLVATLRHQIKLLMLKVRGSRQKHIDPDQLILFSIDELKELADELQAEADDEAFAEDQPPRRQAVQASRARSTRLVRCEADTHHSP